MMMVAGHKLSKYIDDSAVQCIKRASRQGHTFVKATPYALRDSLLFSVG